MIGCEIFARRKLDIRHIGLRTGTAGVQPRPHPQNAYTGNISLQQGVGCLGGAVGDELDILRKNTVFIHNPLNNLDDSAGNSAFIVVCGRHFDLRQHLKGFIVNRDSIREGTPDIYADSDLFIAHNRFSSP
ncbi:hypothetical protein D3C75_1057970 [compost metagenome]